MRLPRSFGLIAPYAAWMVLMTALPATVTGYSVRTAVVAALLVVVWRRYGADAGADSSGSPRRNTGVSLRSSLRSSAPSLVIGVLVGLLTFIVWVAPEQFGWGWYKTWCIVGEGGTQAVAEASVAMIAIRLIGSAFVISVAEELFFRKWLIGFAGFGWMVALFAIEHDRWLVGAIAGVVYGFLYLRKGLLSAIVAHATTNFVLGLWVLKTGQWQFW